MRAATAKPLIVKLTPNTADVALCALAAEQGGADAVSLINTLRASALRPPAPPTRRRRGARPGSAAVPAACPGRRSAPVALAQVAAVAARVEIPVVGMGGVQERRPRT